MCIFEDGTRAARRRAYERRTRRTQAPLPHQNLFEAYLYTKFALSKTKHEPQGGEHMSAELDERYKRLRRVDGHAWRTKRSGIMSGLSLSM